MKTFTLKHKKRLRVLFAMSCCLAFSACPELAAQIISPQPVFFHVSHHQEKLGRYSKDFPYYETFKQDIKTELDLLDQYGVRSDQCFSDFIVSVIQYMYDTGRDTNSFDIYDWFNASDQLLGFHFHPTTWDINIRLDRIKDLDLDSAIMEYEKWEEAYYDWSDCDALHDDSTMFCGTLDTSRLGGIQLMLQHFTKPLVNECLTLINPAAGQVIRNKYGSMVPVVGQAGNPHSYYSTSNYDNLWMSDWMFSAEPGLYVYKMMGNLYIQNRSEAWVEGLMDVEMLKQVLAVLPRDIPHLFAIHLTNPPAGDSTLETNLKYLTNEFLPGNPYSQFISTADLPGLIIPNSYVYSMSDLDAACTDVLSNWHGRPPAYASFNGKYASLASLFKALQAAINAWQNSPLPHSWPASVSVPDFIWPPLGRRLGMPNDTLLSHGFPFTNMLQAVASLTTADSVPYAVSIPFIGQPMRANAAEFLNGMCTLFLRLRQGETFGQLYILPCYIQPISYLPVEVFFLDTANHATPTNMDWLSGLQLWTTEPVKLKTLNELSDAHPVESKEERTFLLEQNYPNPFSENTTIRFYVKNQMPVSIRVYDMMGKNLCTLYDDICSPGWHTLTWNGNNGSGGYSNSSVFLCHMRTPCGSIQKKLIRMK